jgi:hypothetical protein
MYVVLTTTLQVVYLFIYFHFLRYPRATLQIIHNHRSSLYQRTASRTTSFYCHFRVLHDLLSCLMVTPVPLMVLLLYTRSYLFLLDCFLYFVFVFDRFRHLQLVSQSSSPTVSLEVVFDRAMSEHKTSILGLALLRMHRLVVRW